MSKEKQKILSILPAEDWYAIFKEEDGSESSWPVVAWALVEDGYGNTVKGMTCGNEPFVDFADASNFIRYAKVKQH